MQGDIILACPLVGWSEKPPTGATFEDLQKSAEGFIADVIVMTQACDLEQCKVSNVVLCPHYALEDYKDKFREQQIKQKQIEKDGQLSGKAWRRQCEAITAGHLWNLSILNSGSAGGVETSHRVVDFHQMYTAPRKFLELFLAARKERRLRLLPPYREHLSQAFARFFMRVGLPTSIERVW